MRIIMIVEWHSEYSMLNDKVKKYIYIYSLDSIDMGVSENRGFPPKSSIK